MENIDEIVSIFKTGHKFQNAHQEQIKALLLLGQRRLYQKGEVIYSENEPVEGMFLLVTGKVEFYKYTDSGEEKIFGSIKNGEEFGSPELYEERHIVNVRAIEKTETVFITRDQFFREVVKLDSIILGLMRAMGMLIGMLQSDIVNESAESKVCSYLNDLMIYDGRNVDGNIFIPRKHTNEKISSILRLSRETVSRIFSQMKSRGILDIEKEYYLIKEYKAIEQNITVTDRLYDKLKNCK